MNKRHSGRKKVTAVDLGFGLGERIKGWARPDRPERVIWGVETPHPDSKKGKKSPSDGETPGSSGRMSASPRRIPGAHISSVGAIKWLRRQPNNSIRVVNADYLFSNIPRAYLKSDIILLIYKKLAFNGRLFVTDNLITLSSIVDMAVHSGLDIVGYREINSKEQPAYWSRKRTGDRERHRFDQVFRAELAKRKSTAENLEGLPKRTLTPEQERKFEEFDQWFEEIIEQSRRTV